MAYKPKPDAAARRDALAKLVSTGLESLRAGVMPTAEQQEAIRNAYRTARRASREGVRSANTARQMALMCAIEDARKAYPAAAYARLAKEQPGAAAPTAAASVDLDPFTGLPFTQVAPPQSFVL